MGTARKLRSSEPLWWARAAEDPEHVHELIFRRADAIERSQSAMRLRMFQLACLYDPFDQMGMLSAYQYDIDPATFTCENVVQSAIDTAKSMIAQNRPQPKIQTNDAPWKKQRLARQCDQYTYGLFRQTSLYKKGPAAFLDAAVVGLGGVKIYADPANAKKICVDRVLAEEILVDEATCRGTEPRELHQRRAVDRDVLYAAYCDLVEDEAEFAERLVDAQKEREWAGRELEANEVILIESFHLPSGPDADDGWRCLSLSNYTILCEPYTKAWLPYVWLRWCERRAGFYGRGVAEDIAGIQNRINKLNRFIDMAQDLIAIPRVAVHIGDKGLEGKLVNKIGAVHFYRTVGAAPHFNTANAVGPEVYARLEALKASAFELVGISRLSAQSKKPVGLESAVALREYNDIETERFAIQAQAFEAFYLECARLLLATAKEMADDAPEVPFRAKSLERAISWKDVDIDVDPFSMEIEAASTLSRTPAGRLQAVIEMMQGGLIGPEEGRRLLRHPDLEREASLSNAAFENIERTIEQFLDGEDVVPESYQNLALGVLKVTQAYLKASDDGAPEDILENVRTWVVQAAHLLQAAQTPDPAAMGAPPPGAEMPPPDAGMPPGGAPTAGLAPQAMQLSPV